MSGHGAELWLAALDDLAEPLADLDRCDPLGAVDMDGPPIDGPRRVARHLLRRLIARTFGRAAAVGAFAQGPHGKPVLPGLGGDFNLSHTTDGTGRSFALIGVGRVAAIGVDVEPVRTVRLDPRRQELIIAAAEALAEGAALPGSGEARILQAWARLEAWGKADGRGIGRTLTHCGIWGRSAQATTGAVNGGSLLVHDVDADAGLFAAVALPRGIPAPAVRWIPVDLPSLQALLGSEGGGANSGVDLAPGAGQKGPVRSVAQPG